MLRDVLIASKYQFALKKDNSRAYFTVKGSSTIHSPKNNDIAENLEIVQ